MFYNMLDENEEEHSHEVDEKQVVLLALQKYSNYSVKVAAFTSAGVGVKSDPIYCHTAQDSKYIFSTLIKHNFIFKCIQFTLFLTRFTKLL